MASEAERKRRKKLARARALSAPPAAAVHSTARPAPRAKVASRAEEHAPRDGLSWLADKNKITRRQLRAGREYGLLARTAEIAGDASIPSSIRDNDAIAGGAGAALADLTGGEWIAECRARLALARAVVGHLAEYIAVLDLVCGRGTRLTEIPGITEKEVRQLETTLRVALDLLAAHFWPEGARGGGAPFR